MYKYKKEIRMITYKGEHILMVLKHMTDAQAEELVYRLNNSPFDTKLMEDY